MAKTNKQEILAEAAILFWKQGYSNTSIEEIGVAVGLLKGSIYHHFKSKEDILYEIVKPVIEGSLEAMEKVLKSDLSPDEKLDEAIRVHLRLFDEYFPSVFVAMGGDFSSFSKERLEEIIRFRSRYEQLWLEMISDGIKAGHFRADLNPKLTSYAILGMCNWMFKWFKKGGMISASQIAEHYSALVRYGMLSSSTGRKPRK